MNETKPVLIFNGDYKRPTKLTILSNVGDDSITIEFDKPNNRWDVSVTGNQTEAFKSFIKWMSERLPLCKCMSEGI